MIIRWPLGGATVANELSKNVLSKTSISFLIVTAIIIIVILY